MADLVKDKSPRSLQGGKRPAERTLEELLSAGVINLDKVQGPTSHQVTAWVKDVLGVTRIGHGGTLDPQVSGVLPIALGRATKLTDLVLRSDKEYVCHMKLHRDKPAKRVEEVLLSFVGEIYQVPPVRAAVKRQVRVRRVQSIKVLEISGRDALFRVSCDAGTYIRTLCVDVGEALGIGANMESLRRTRSGSLLESGSVTLQQVRDAVYAWKEENDPSQLRAMLMPMEILLEPLPKVLVKDGAVSALCHGADLAAPGVVRLDENVAKGALVALMTQKGEAIGLGITMMAGEDILKAKEGVVVRLDRVLMEAETYPRLWSQLKTGNP
ncbi:MAG: putative tRNA pseudouridine synthase B [Methanomassiliicoccales archaeon PtaU1.Bin124]|nr:MAG: putative tRNA pseudouridine synthase B [Methanomassiliicoccales archaeon PtaU1.Bin124]